MDEVRLSHMQHKNVFKIDVPRPVDDEHVQQRSNWGMQRKSIELKEVPDLRNARFDFGDSSPEKELPKGAMYEKSSTLKQQNSKLRVSFNSSD